MATFSPALSAVKSQLGRFVPESMIFNVCRECRHKWRHRKQDPAVTVHLLLLQLLARVSLVGLDRVAQLGISAAAVCKARKKLPLEVLTKLAEWTGRCDGEAGRCDGKMGKATADGRYKGRDVCVADATTFTTPDTPELAAKYGKASNQKKTRPGYPIVKLLALMNLATGTLTKVIDLPHARGEATVLTRMIKWIKPGSVIVGDRGLVSFAHVAKFIAAGIDCLTRLPRHMVVHGRGKGSRTKIKQLGRYDMLVRWDKPKRHELKWLSKFSWKKLPQSLTLRQVGFKLYRKGFRPNWVWVITTLTDPVEYPAAELAGLYGKRWNIELEFRDLKTSLKMNRLTAEDVDGIKKQVMGFVILYNLIRRLMCEAAVRQRVKADRISFIDTARALLWLAEGASMPQLKVNPQRKRPSQPRERKHGGYKYPVMKKPREQLQRPHAKAVIGKAMR